MKTRNKWNNLKARLCKIRNKHGKLLFKTSVGEATKIKLHCISLKETKHKQLNSPSIVNNKNDTNNSRIIKYNM